MAVSETLLIGQDEQEARARIVEASALREFAAGYEAAGKVGLAHKLNDIADAHLRRAAELDGSDSSGEALQQ